MSTQMKRVADDIIEALSKSGDDVAQKVTRHLRKHKRKLDDVAAQTRRTDREMAHRTPNRRPDVDRVDMEVTGFRRNPRHDPDEFSRQFNEQMDALENTPADQLLDRLRSYRRTGRTDASLAQQQAAREDAFEDLVDELTDQGVDIADARTAANEWLRTQAATHRLDGIAGGSQTDISGVGDSPINSSLGSQWRTRSEQLLSQLEGLEASGVDLSSIYVTLNFTA